jgi:hypothetical protein
MAILVMFERVRLTRLTLDVYDRFSISDTMPESIKVRVTIAEWVKGGSHIHYGELQCKDDLNDGERRRAMTRM